MKKVILTVAAVFLMSSMAYAASTVTVPAVDLDTTVKGVNMNTAAVAGGQANMSSVVARNESSVDAASITSKVNVNNAAMNTALGFSSTAQVTTVYANDGTIGASGSATAITLDAGNGTKMGGIILNTAGASMADANIATVSATDGGSVQVATSINADVDTANAILNTAFGLGAHANVATITAKNGSTLTSDTVDMTTKTGMMMNTAVGSAAHAGVSSVILY